MPNNAREVAGSVSAIPQQVATSATAGLRAASRAAQNEAVDRTTARYNLTADVVRKNVRLREISEGANSATVSLLIRAIPIEDFSPEIRMKRFRWTDRLGRSHSQLLPAVFFQRLRGRAPRFLRPAFPLTQRQSGQLRQGERIRRRVGKERDRLTHIRFFTFPKQFLRQELLPAVQARMADGFGVEFRAAFRRFRGGRTRLRQPN